MRPQDSRESRRLQQHLMRSGELRKPAQIEEKMANVAAVNDANFQAEVLDASKTQPVMVDFWAEWCGPCRVLSPTVDAIATERAGKLKVVKMNVDENMNTPGRYNIRGIPTLLIFKGGQVAEQIVGAVPKEHIEKALERHLAH